ncbi:hypothetical protein D3C77_366370 [compost metagenome]
MRVPGIGRAVDNKNPAEGPGYHNLQERNANQCRRELKRAGANGHAALAMGPSENCSARNLRRRCK